jgi:hypothetical protein
MMMRAGFVLAGRGTLCGHPARPNREQRPTDQQREM